MKVKTKILAFLLALTIVIPCIKLVNTPVYAETFSSAEENFFVGEEEFSVEKVNADKTASKEASVSANGTCGEKLTWTLKGGKLTISGVGAMGNYEEKKSPWYSYRSSINCATIDKSVTSIGSNAFYDCTSLNVITISDSVKSINDLAFSCCDSGLIIRGNPGSYAETYSKTKNIIFSAPVGSCGQSAMYTLGEDASVTIEGAGVINEEAFYGWNLTSLNVSTGLTGIGNSSFEECDSLSSVVIGDSVTNIGSNAFYNCDSLTTVTIPKSVTVMDYRAFSSCDALEEVHISDVASWCNISFYNYYSTPLCYAEKLFLNGKLVTDLVIPDSVTSIGNYAFENCSSFKSITLPDSVTNIGSSAFSGCTSLASISLPDSVTNVGYSAFRDCTSLKSVTIPDSVTSIGNYAFENCDSLEKVYISDVASWCNILFYDYDSNPLYYAEKLYLNNILVTNLVIPDSVTSIGNYAFENCISLEYVTIPDSVTSIGSNAFENCDSLTSVTLPDSVTSVGSNAFKNCDAFETVIIPNSVTSIGNNAFYNCATNLVFLGQSDSYAETYANNSGYQFIPYTDRCGDNATAEFKNGKLTINGSGSMYFGVYKNIPIIKDVVISKGITSIGMEVFYHCAELKTVTIPRSVTNIGISAFGSCNSLTDVYYSGTKEEWNAITKGLYNESLLNATIHFGNVSGITVKDDKYKVENDIIFGIAEFTTVSSLSDIISNSEYTVTDANGIVLTDDALVGTGCVISIPTGESVTVVVKGDTDGNGEIDATDYARMKTAFLNSTSLDGAYKSASDVNNDGEMDATDYAIIKSHFLGKADLYA